MAVGPGSTGRRSGAVAAGHICLDLMPGLGSRDLALAPGALRIAGPMTISTGGSVSNTGIALHRLGVPTRLVALVGSDPLGEVLRGALERESPGLAAGLVAKPDMGTSYSVILSTAATDRIVIHFPGANDSFGASDIDQEALRGAELMHVGYPPLMERLCRHDGLELEKLLRGAGEAGVATSLDMAEPDERVAGVDWPALLGRSLPHVDLFLPSFGELRTMLGTGGRGGWDGVSPPHPEEVRDLAERAIELGAAVAGVKLGRFGLYLRSAGAGRIARLVDRLPRLDPVAWSDRELWCPIFEVPVVGTTGSGDTTIAGFLAAVLEGRGPAEAMELASAVGSLCVEVDDAVSGIRSRAQAEDRIHAGLPRPVPPIFGGWRSAHDGEVRAGPRDRAGPRGRADARPHQEDRRE
jgi:sugar/nucleoside kinase (ribokinase family)